MSSLTLDLILRPTRGWQRLADGEPLRARPSMLAGAVAATSVGLAMLGALATDTVTVGRATLILLATCAGYVGSSVLVARLAPGMIEHDTHDSATLATYASGAALPVIATGIAYLAPWEPSWWLVSLLGCALTASSAATGARRYLHLRGGHCHRTAAIVAALASAPVLAVATFRSVAWR